MHLRASGGALPACQVITALLEMSRLPISPGRTRFAHRRPRQRCSCRSHPHIPRLPSPWTLVYLRQRRACMTASSLQSPWQEYHRQIIVTSRPCHQSQYLACQARRHRNIMDLVLALHSPRRRSIWRTLIIRLSHRTRTCHLMTSYMPWLICTSSTSTLGARYYIEKPRWTHCSGRQ